MCAHPCQCRHMREVWKGYTEMRQEANWGRSYSCSQIIYSHIIWLQRRFKGWHSIYSTKQGKKTNEEGFPGGSVIRNLLCNARDTGCSLIREDSTRLRATKPLEQLSLCSRAQELQLRSPRAAATEIWVPGAHSLQQEKLPQWEARTPQRRVVPASRS